MKVILVFPLLFVAKLLMTFGPVEAMNVNNQPRNEITKTSSSKKLHSGSSSVAKPHVASGLAPSTFCSSSASANVNAVSNVPITLEDGTLLTGIEDIIYGIDFTVILRKDGTVWGLGNNDHGQLGVGSIAELFATPIQTEEGALRDVTGIWSDGITIFAERTDGTIWKSSDEASNGCFNDQDEHLSILKSKNKNSFLAENHCKLQEDRCRMLFNPGDSSLPEEWLLKYFGYTGVDSLALAPNGSGLTIFQCYLQGVDPKQAEPEEPFAISISATGPYRAPANIELIVNVRCPANTSISKVEYYCNGDCLGTNTTSPYQFTLNGFLQNAYRIEARAYDSTGKVATATTEFEVVPSNRYYRGNMPAPFDYFSSIIAIDSQKGIFLDKKDLNQAVDFRTLFPENKYPNYPWFLRAASYLNDPCYHIIYNKNQISYLPVNNIPTINGVSVGGQPPMVAFGSRGGGTPLYINQNYRFGIAGGGQRPEAMNNPDIKIEVYDKEDFVLGANNVAPVYTETYTLPLPGNKSEWSKFNTNGLVQDYHLIQTNNSKVIDFETQVQYATGRPFLDSFGETGTYPLLITHKAANDFYYYKISVMGSGSLPTNNVTLFDMARNESQTDQAYNISYSLDFEQSLPWQSKLIKTPHFQGVFLPSQYQGKDVDELIHQAPLVNDTLSIPDKTGFTLGQLTQLNNSPELKIHPELDKLVIDKKNDPIALANYVLNEIELTDAIGYNINNEVNCGSINPQGIGRDALATYLERQGSPIEQCALLIYLLRKAGYPAAYVFPEHDKTLMFDKQLSKLLRMQLRGTMNFTKNAGLPELIPVNYPWVATYINGKWVHIFPWLKDTEVSERKDIWNYFPIGYQMGKQWLLHYLLNDPTIRSLSKEDNIGTLFPLYAEKELKKSNLTLDDVGIKYKNRPYNCSKDDFPRPWRTPVISDDNLAQNLDASQNPKLASTLTDIFDTIDIAVISDRKGTGNPDLKAHQGEPVIHTGPMRMVDLHDRRLLLYHEVIQGSNPTKYNMILSLDSYDSSPGSNDNKATYNFNSDERSNSDLFRSARKSSVILDNNDDSLVYTISYVRHPQAENKKVIINDTQQFPGLYELLTINDTRSLRKGDMACLSLDYGRVTQEMLDFQANKFSSYQQTANTHSETSLDPSIIKGQLLELMGQSYYYQISQCQQMLEWLTKTHPISVAAHGLAKLSPQRNEDNSLTISTDNGIDDINLIYPNVDMSFQTTALVGNGSSHLDSGDTLNTARSIGGELMIGEMSADEHRIINQFFHQDSAISTVKLLDIAQGWTSETGCASKPGEGVLILTSANYQEEGNLSYAANKTTDHSPVSHLLSEWASLGGEWNNVKDTFSDPNKGPLSTIIMTPGPITAAGQQGTPYTGMGAMVFGVDSFAALISAKMTIANGGYGGATHAFDDKKNLNIQLSPSSGGGFSIGVQTPISQREQEQFNNWNKPEDLYNRTHPDTPYTPPNPFILET